MDRQLQEIADHMKTQTVREEQMLAALQTIAGWGEVKEDGDPGFCGVPCQLEQINETLQDLRDILLQVFKA